MRRFWFVLAMIFVVLLQVSFVPAMRPFGIVPDLLMVVVILIGLDSTVSRALIVGVTGGVLLDLTSGADFGLRTGLFILLSLAAGLVHRSGLNIAGPIIALALTALGTALQTLAIIISITPLVEGGQIGYILTRFGIELAVNLGLVILLQPLIRWLVTEPNEVLSVA